MPPDRVTRYGLTVERAPYALYWQGLRYLRPAGEVKAMYLLVQRGRVSHLALEMLAAGENAVTPVTKVYVSRLRKWLRSLDGAPDIVTERGFGYSLAAAN